jgi:hypothetical protein
MFRCFRDITPPSAFFASLRISTKYALAEYLVFYKTRFSPPILKNCGTSEQNSKNARNYLAAYRFFLFRSFLFCGTNEAQLYICAEQTPFCIIYLFQQTKSTSEIYFNKQSQLQKFISTNEVNFRNLFQQTKSTSEIIHLTDVTSLFRVQPCG